MSKISQKEFTNTNGKKIIIRSALVKDAAMLLKLTKEIIKEGPYMLHEPDEYKMTIKKQKDQIRNYSEKDSKLFLVADSKNYVVGYLTFINGGLRRTKHMGYIGLFIKKEFRDKGIGARLMKELITWAKENPGLEKLSLAVFSNNTRAFALYKKMGFRPEGRCFKDVKVKGEYIDSILMYLFV